MNTRNTTMSADLGTLPQSQSGVALIIGLVLLITLTILGIGTLSTTSLEQRMAGNMGDLNLAFNAAETAGQCYANIIAKSSTFRGQKTWPMVGGTMRLMTTTGGNQLKQSHLAYRSRKSVANHVSWSRMPDFFNHTL